MAGLGLSQPASNSKATHNAEGACLRSPTYRRADLIQQKASRKPLAYRKPRIQLYSMPEKKRPRNTGP